MTRAYGVQNTGMDLRCCDTLFQLLNKLPRICTTWCPIECKAADPYAPSKMSTSFPHCAPATPIALFDMRKVLSSYLKSEWTSEPKNPTWTRVLRLRLISHDSTQHTSGTDVILILHIFPPRALLLHCKHRERSQDNLFITGSIMYHCISFLFSQDRSCTVSLG